MNSKDFYKLKIYLLIFLWLSVSWLNITNYSVFPPQVDKVFAGTADFDVQRGCEIPAASTTAVTLTAGTDYTAPTSNSNTFVRFISTRLTGTGNTVAGGNQNPDDWTWYISDPDFAGGTIVFTRVGAANPQRFCWEIIEYVGAVAGANEMIVRQVGTVAYATTSTSVDTSTVSGVSDDNDIVVFITGQNSHHTGTSRQAVNAAFSTSEWVSASDIGRFTRGIAGGDANTLSYAIVEFTGSNWSIERVAHTFTADATTETETISSVGDISRAFMHTQFTLDEEEGLDDTWCEMWISSTTTVSFRTQAASGSLPSQEHAVVWVVKNSDTVADSKMNVQHMNGTRVKADISEGAANEEDEWSETITAVGSVAETSIMGESGRSTGSGTAFPRGAITFYLNSTTSVKLYQSDDGQTQTYRYQVIEWPQTAAASVSISISTDGSVAFQTIELNTTEDTTATGINDTEVISVDTGPADLNVKSTAFTEGGNTWALATSNGANQVLWEFSPDGSTWPDFAVLDTYYSLATNVSESSTQNLDLRLTLPTTTNSYSQYSTTVTVQAVAP